MFQNWSSGLHEFACWNTKVTQYYISLVKQRNVLLLNKKVYFCSIPFHSVVRYWEYQSETGKTTTFNRSTFTGAFSLKDYIAAIAGYFVAARLGHLFNQF